MDPAERNRPFAHVVLLQAPDVYELVISMGDASLHIEGLLDDFEALGREIGFKTQSHRHFAVQASPLTQRRKAKGKG